MSEEQPHVGIAWFDRAQWQRLTEAVPDRNELDNTFEAWERSAKKTFKEFKRSGQIVEKVAVKVEDLLAWCTLHGVIPNGSSRAEYVSELLKRRSERKL